MQRMTFREAKPRIIRDTDLRQWLEPDSTGKHYCCLVCGSGKGEHGTANTRLDPVTNLFTCFQKHSLPDGWPDPRRGLNAIDLCMIATGRIGPQYVMPIAKELGERIGIEVVPDPEYTKEGKSHNGALDWTSEIETDWEPPETAQEAPGDAAGAEQYQNTTHAPATSEKAPAQAEKPAESAPPAPQYQDTTNGSGDAPAPSGAGQGAADPAQTGTNKAKTPLQMMLETAREILLHDDAGKPGREYLRRRGISLETASLFSVGFYPDLDMFGKGYKNPRLTVPLNDCTYYGIDVRQDCDPKYRRLVNKGGTLTPLNGDALWKDDVQCVFLCEGWADALSFIEIGYQAIALNGIGNGKALLKEMEQRKPSCAVILCLDTDGPGKAVATEMFAGLKALEIPCYDRAGKICGDCKDPNEALVKDRAKFAATVAQIAAEADPNNWTLAQYIRTEMAGDILRNMDVIPTGFAGLDAKLGGGLRAGFYVVPAISALGKTTLVHQIADNIARDGRDVLFCSLEMSRLELVSKSIARQMYMDDRGNAITSAQFRRGAAKAPAVQDAITKYAETIGKKLSMIEGNFSTSAEDIASKARQYRINAGKAPVVIVDYLQILQPDPTMQRMGLREIIDGSVKRLKLLSRALSVPVIAISSVGRANYLTPISFESLKESGGIEFTADVVLGLQFSCLDDDLFDKQGSLKEKREKITEAKAETPRKIQLRCLKNRYGREFGLDFWYWPEHDFFEESPQGALNDFETVKKETQKKRGRKR